MKDTLSPLEEKILKKFDDNFVYFAKYIGAYSWNIEAEPETVKHFLLQSIREAYEEGLEDGEIKVLKSDFHKHFLSLTTKEK